MRLLLITFLLTLSAMTSLATDREEVSVNSDKSGEQDEKFNPADMILEHIQDSNEWHLWTTTDDNGVEHHVSIPLPIIIWDGRLKMFMSSSIAHGHEYEGYTLEKGKIKSLSGLQEATLLDLFGGMENKYIDLSITKNVFAIFLSIGLMLFIFIVMARSYRKNSLKPRGIAGFLEPIVLFVRDDIAIPNIGKYKYEKYMTYLLTVFFFIWFNNLLGLLPLFPGGANVTGNISVTMVLAIFTGLIVNFSGNKGYWKHIFKMPGVPLLMLPIMIPVEIIGIFTKPFALMIRLFANITAGHIMVLSLVSLIFIFQMPIVSLGAIPMILFIFVLKLLVAILQAYIFTILSALFIGMAVTEEH